MDLELIKRTGISAAYKSAELLRRHKGALTKVDKKGAIDLVTEADKGSEKIIIETIQKRFPEHNILAEESGLKNTGSAYTWIIDPLDGTTNYVHQLDTYAISIAFFQNGRVDVGVVLSPETGELFTAVRSHGAELNGHSINVSSTSQVSESLLVTGFPYQYEDILMPLMTRFKKCLCAAQGIRRLGSAALDLCFVACGRFEGFWEQQLNPWDTAAGALIAEEAGAMVTDFSNMEYTLEKKEILATNGHIHNNMISLLEIDK